MRVTNRDGTTEPVDFNKITKRLELLVNGFDENGLQIGHPLSIDPIEVSKEICRFIVDLIPTSKLDEEAAAHCASRIHEHNDFETLATRIIISNYHKRMRNHRDFSKITEALANNVNEQGLSAPMVSPTYHRIVTKYKDVFNKVVNDNHVYDYKYLSYFGFKTLIKSYLMKPRNLTSTETIQESFQHLLLRESLGIHLNDILAHENTSGVNPILKEVLDYYNLLSKTHFTHATPTLFNAGTSQPQLASCFLLGMEDSIEGIYKCNADMAKISKRCGGIGVNMSKIRCQGSYISGTHGQSSGIIPAIKVINELVRHVDQGGNKRKGSIAIYLEAWHGDLMGFLELKKNQGAEELRARDLFYGLWVPDLFMKRLQTALQSSEPVMWSLMCPNISQGLADKYGDEFEQLYHHYESNRMYVRQENILTIWKAIIHSQMETGTPYILYKDTINRRSNQMNIGPIRCSNLCAEIVEYSDHQEYGTCNLASLNLKSFVHDGQFDFSLLHDVTMKAVIGLNRVIDSNYYPVPESKRSNCRHRPIGLGVQGLADTFFLLELPYDSEQAAILNREIFRTIYHGALTASMTLAKTRHEILSQLDQETYSNLLTADRELFKLLCDKYGLSKLSGYGTDLFYEEFKYMTPTTSYRGAYSTFEGSPASQGLLQFDLAGQPDPSFDSLKTEINRYGLRNSLLVALMPTATTAQILGNVEGHEAITSNFYTRQVLAGSFLVVNTYLQNKLTQMGLWNSDLVDQILINHGSVQHLDIPQNVKDVFKTSWEISKKQMINMARDRGYYIDQTQSFNLFVADPTENVLTSIHLYGWSQGLKTGCYYLRRSTLANALQFTIDHEKIKKANTSPKMPDGAVCTRSADCMACSS